MYNKKDHRFENLTEDEYKAFLNLTSNKSIIIQEVDKGSSVVLDRLKYVCKMEELVSDHRKKILFHFVKKFLTKYQIYLWHVLVFSHCSQKYPWMKRLIFVLICFSMLKRHFKHLLTLSVKSSCFFFNVYYKQVDGIAMGFSLGPTLATMFLVYYEHKWLEVSLAVSTQVLS